MDLAPVGVELLSGIRNYFTSASRIHDAHHLCCVTMARRLCMSRAHRPRFHDLFVDGWVHCGTNCSTSPSCCHPNLLCSPGDTCGSDKVSTAPAELPAAAAPGAVKTKSAPSHRRRRLLVLESTCLSVAYAPSNRRLTSIVRAISCALVSVR